MFHLRLTYSTPAGGPTRLESCASKVRTQFWPNQKEERLFLPRLYKNEVLVRGRVHSNDAEKPLGIFGEKSKEEISMMEGLLVAEQSSRRGGLLLELALDGLPLLTHHLSG